MTEEETFKNTLENLRQDSWGGIQLLYLHMAFNEVLSRRKEYLSVVNQTPVLWNSTTHGWQCGYMIALGRAYDHTTQNNLGFLLDLFSKNLDIFSKDALATRKRAESSNADEWLPNFLRQAYVPTDIDVKRIRSRANIHQDLYNEKYRPLRSKVFAHRVLGNSKDVVKLYSATRIDELQKLFLYLLKLYEALWQLYMNGERPVLKPIKYSLKAFMENAEKWPTIGRVHEAVVAEMKEIMELLLAGATQQENPADCQKAAVG